MAHEMRTPTMAGDGLATPAGAGPGATPARGGGWLAFAAVMFWAAAGLNAIWGIAALANDDYFAVDELLFGDLTMWGWLYIGFAVVQLATGVLIVSSRSGRRAVGAAVGIGIALLHAMMVLLSIGAYPIWSIILLAIDGMIVYGLAAYGFGDAEA